MDNGASSYLRFLNGDNDAFVEIIKQYKDGLILFIDSFTNDIHISEEIADEAFLNLYVKKPHYKRKYSFKTWLYTIGRNIAVDHKRRLLRRKNVSLNECIEIADEADLERSYLVTEQKINLRHAICRLKEDYQQVLYLTYFEDFSNEETAKITGKSVKQIKNLLYNARKALKTELEKEGFKYENI